MQFKYDGYKKSEKQLSAYFAYNTEQEAVTMQTIFQDLNIFIEDLHSSKLKLQRLNEQMRKRQRKKEKSRRARTETFNRAKFQKLAAPKKRYSLAIDDVGTPVEDQQEQETLGVVMEHIDNQIDKHIDNGVKKQEIEIEYNRFRRKRTRSSTRRDRGDTYTQKVVQSEQEIATISQSQSEKQQTSHEQQYRIYRTVSSPEDRNPKSLRVELDADQVYGMEADNNNKGKRSSVPTKNGYVSKRKSSKGKHRGLIKRVQSAALLTPSASRLTPVTDHANVESDFDAAVKAATAKAKSNRRAHRRGQTLPVRRTTDTAPVKK